MSEDIYFYGRTKGRVSARYRFLSNFYKAPFTLEGREYATVEHYFQSRKHAGAPLEEEVRNAPTPRRAKDLANSGGIPPDWEDVKEDVMLRALRAKFGQNPDLARKLLDTGDAALHEDSPGDMYWGVRGKDRLGRLLMQVREELRASDRWLPSPMD